MKTIARGRQFIGLRVLCAGAVIALLAACEPPPPPPVQVVYTPPPISLPNKLVEAATVYSAYVEEAAAITPDFTDGSVVAAKLRTGSAYEAQQFERGEAAYAAIVALQDPVFVAGVRAFAADPAQRTMVIGEILKNPAYVLGIKGSDSAAGLVVSALSAQGQRVLGAGQKVKQAAYDVQKQDWSKASVADRDGRLAMAKTLSTQVRTASMDETMRLRMAAIGQTPLAITGSPAQPPYSPLLVRALAVAAMAALGEGTEANTDTLWALLDEPNQNMCFNMSKLNLYQCLSVAKPHYEDVFCLGQHVLMDTGQCINRASGVFTPPPPLVDRPDARPYQDPRAAGSKASAARKKR